MGMPGYIELLILAFFGLLCCVGPLVIGIVLFIVLRGQNGKPPSA